MLLACQDCGNTVINRDGICQHCGCTKPARIVSLPFCSCAWRPGSELLLESEENGVWVGDSILAAVPVAGERGAWWELSVVTASESGGWEVDGSQWSWSTECIEWWVPIRELTKQLPRITEDES